MNRITGKKSLLEVAFLNRWRMLAQDAPEPMAEHRFAPPRRFRFDFAWPDKLIAVELEGGVWARGRHVRGRGYESDCEKYNLAQSLGWSVYRFTAGMLDRDPAGCVEQVAAALKGVEELPFSNIAEEAR
jgi:very-short-patch-repair endonuclease